MPWFEYTESAEEGRRLPLVEVLLRRGDEAWAVPAMLDPGAGQSVFDLALARALGLDPTEAEVVDVGMGDGTKASMLRWPDSDLVMEFSGHTASFAGLFADPPERGDFVNLLGRDDFLAGLVLQVWNDRGMFNLDSSPDFPGRALGWASE